MTTGPLELLCLFLASALVDGRSLTLEALNTTTYPLARCNDGTDAAIYTAFPTSYSGPRTFVVYLSSGGWCYSKTSCAERWLTSQSLMSSKNYKATEKIGGIFDSTVFDEASTVWINVPYCSSDGHMGNIDNDEIGYVFRGHEIVKAVLNTVQDRYGVGAGDVVVWGGASAGARGAMVHLDYVSEFFSDSKVVGILDSPLWVDLDPPEWSDSIGLLEQTKQVYEISGVGAVSGPDGVVTEDCASAHEGEEYKCLFGQYRMPFVSPPHLLISSEFDSFQLGEDGLSIPFDEKANEYADSFGAKMHSVFLNLTEIPAQNASLYSQPCYNHAISMSSKYFTSSTRSGVTLDDAVAIFMESPLGFSDLTDYCEEGFSSCTSDGSKCSYK